MAESREKSQEQFYKLRAEAEDWLYRGNCHNRGDFTITFEHGGQVNLAELLASFAAIEREAGRRDALEEQWISVEEKLPKCEGYYLVVHVRRGIDMLWSNPASPSDLWYWKSEVTHWRELPEPPKLAIRALEEKP